MYNIQPASERCAAALQPTHGKKYSDDDRAGSVLRLQEHSLCVGFYNVVVDVFFFFCR